LPCVRGTGMVVHFMAGFENDFHNAMEYPLFHSRKLGRFGIFQYFLRAKRQTNRLRGLIVRALAMITVPGWFLQIKTLATPLSMTII